MKKDKKKIKELVKALNFSASKNQFDDETLTICNIVGSTENRDTYGDVIIQSGWNLEDFKKNPVILYAHDRCNLPIGKATEVYVSENKLKFTVQFAPTKAGQEIYSLLKEGYLSAFSVGLYVEESKYDPDTDTFFIIKATLKELSVVPVPANQEALLERVKAAFEFSIKNTSTSNNKTVSGEPKTKIEKLAELGKKECDCSYCQNQTQYMTKAEVEALVNQKIKEFQSSQKVAQVEMDRQKVLESKTIEALKTLGHPAIKEANRATGKLLKEFNKLIKKESSNYE